ncbi:DUF5103 domain-containing protein [Leptobacterium flavescens]|uniref:DUF5103 domain-containing protein n=1 Tax=Leptobacterium flavescens TaxID=472055 RepID=A0A6P0UJ58_9FLAO|nr:DUF5103 domain-containing protein [Leptobacterium flavescens]NER12420.1 DUF5103 domain-containing protein [Leptobacterium flavescens]
MIKTLKCLIFVFLCFATVLNAQVEYEISPPDHIRSIVFKSANEGDLFPIVKIGESFTLSFDDITASEADYYYKIVHCNYDWTPSNLSKMQYLNGLDNQRIQNYQNSYNTLQPYSNYQLSFPNSLTRLKLTGNYVLKIYNSSDELQFSRRFVIYRDAVNVGAYLKRSRDLNTIYSKQVVQFTINSSGFQLVNPQKEVKVAILQNHYWPGAITGVRPQFFSGNQLIYKYDKETSFDGGNEFLFYDNKEIRTASNGVFSVELDDLYNHYLYTAKNRSDFQYTFNPDVNGDFVVRTLEGEDNDTEADYAQVHFSLEYDNSIGLDKVYVFGKFNNFELNEENELKLNVETGLLETTMLLKQGFYNYKFVVVNENGEIDYNRISGNHYQTENNYTVIVYYRNFGDRYDSVIGIGSASSVNISN